MPTSRHSVYRRSDSGESIERGFDTLDCQGVTVLVCPANGTLVAGERDAVDLLGEAFAYGASWVAVPVDRLGAEFFDLRTRVAGDIVQKFANYRVGLAITGDIERHTTASSALRDFVRESDRGRQLWFVPDLPALAARLTGD